MGIAGTILKLLGVALALALVSLAIVLGEAHLQIRDAAPPLPGESEIRGALAGGGGPIRIRSINTATQIGLGPAPLIHPSFLLEWPDGRSFLIDAGMEPDAAVAFGRPMELILGSQPTTPHGAVATQLGDASRRVAGIAFTHLHVDHTQGIAALCAAHQATLPVYQTPRQYDEQNYTTSPGLEQIEAAGCSERVRLARDLLAPIPGFPGLFATVAAGHTPGSTVFFARVQDTIWILAGDVTNFAESIHLDRPKSPIYSWLIVPENRERLAEARAWLRGLSERSDMRVIVSHDGSALEASGMPAARPSRSILRDHEPS